ncbi:MAG: ABC transporter substrate binding protein [Phycisphaerae bacterium]
MVSVLRKFRFGASGNRDRSKDRIVRKLVFVCLTLLIFFPALSWAKDKNSPTVGIVYGPQASYRDAVLSMQKFLESQECKCVLVELPKPDQNVEDNTILARLSGIKPQVFVGVGTQAVAIIRQSDPKIPMVFCMIPNVLDAPFWDEKNKNQFAPAGVSTDIDPDEQIAWIKRIAPEIKNIGVFFSPRTRKTSESIQNAGRKAGIEVTPIQTDREKITDAFKELDQKDCDAVLMLPDVGIYNSTNVRALLLLGMRQKKVVFGFSESVVKAGGFAGQYCNTAEVGKQTGELVQELLKGKKTDNIGLQYTGSIQRAVNLRTAEMIEKPIDETLLDKNVVRFGND